jgi:hypothetical protein
VGGGGGGSVLGDGSDCAFSGTLQFGQAIRNRFFKLIRDADGSEEFYNLVLDPIEEDDLLLLPELPPFAEQNLGILRAALDALTGSG